MRVTSEEEERVVRLLVADVRATLGSDYDLIVVSHARMLRGLADPADYVRRVVEDVQQQIHDEFIDTSWPPCPRHPNHPLWVRDGVWWCERDEGPIAKLGELR